MPKTFLTIAELAAGACIALSLLFLPGCGAEMEIEDIDVNTLDVVGGDEAAWVEVGNQADLGELGAFIHLPSDAYDIAFRINEAEGIVEASFTIDDDNELKKDDDAGSTVWRTDNNDNTEAISSTPFVVRVSAEDHFVNNSGVKVDKGKVKHAYAAARTIPYYRAWNNKGQGLSCWYDADRGLCYSVYIPQECKADYLTLLTKITIAGADLVIED